MAALEIEAQLEKDGGIGLAERWRTLREMRPGPDDRNGTGSSETEKRWRFG
jgi:hypothetical protein